MNSYLKKLFWLAILAGVSVNAGNAIAQTHGEPIPIGAIQGVGDRGSSKNQTVTFRGVVTGLMADQNSRGAVFHTFFVQDLPGSEDGDPQSSDGMPVFAGNRRPNVHIGDVVLVTGKVTEFYGLTEIEDDDLLITIERSGEPLPDPIPIDPPPDNQAAQEYYEPYEGMRVKLAGDAVVVGATFSSCSFSVAAGVGDDQVLRRTFEDPIGEIIPVLNQTDVSCHGFPDVKRGDVVSGLAGPLTYHFDLFKIVVQNPAELAIQSAPLPPLPVLPHLTDSQFSLASFNVENYFDLVDDTGDNAEPKPSPGELALKQEKLAHAISQILGCPTILAIQEVEKGTLLQELAAQLAQPCGFVYVVTHLESPDARGIDLAAMTHPDRVTIQQAQLRQTCSFLTSDTIDPSIDCKVAEQPLFSRPPLQIDLIVDELPMTLFVNHFKSKRGGEESTSLKRMGQALYLNELANEILAVDPDANVVLLGDFNDYDQSPSSLTVGEGLVDVLQQVSERERYSFVFSGASQLIDGIYMSPNLANKVTFATLLHINADYPDAFGLENSPDLIGYKSSDHDPPLVVVDLQPSADPTPVSAAIATPTQTPIQEGELNEPIDRRRMWLTNAGIYGGAFAAILGIAWWRRRKADEEDQPPS